ncbi:DUF3954 domain-containing protein [Salicibibacter halophilus]|uniref:DUF3954 domain-containing protein n=2 Tax=Salicibibacter halophilus TaxID=2502791 RepID=A0A514LM70_9BACI|nr:DUF3954 domain-containing protein [Salicibibacter halophilus]
MKAEIDCSEDSLYVVKNGKVTKVNKPQSGYGQQNIVWLGGKVDRVESTESQKI